jgi:hypothetical protein
MGKRLMLLPLLGLAACTAPTGEEREPVHSNQAAGVAQAERNNGRAEGPPTRLARLPENPMGDAASTAGILEADGGCLYLRSEAGDRYLIASTIPGGTWDSASGALVVRGSGGGTFRPGNRVSLGGSEGRAATLSGQWVDPPGSGCDTRRIWVANSIRAVAGR